MTLKKSLLWLFALMVIIILVISLGWDDIRSALLRVHPMILIGLLVLQTATILAVSFQWRYLLKKTNRPVSLLLTLLINLAGNFIESVTPSVKLGGEAAKVIYYHKYTGLGYDRLTGIMLALKLFSLLPFVVFSALALLLAITVFELPAITLIAFVLLFVVVFMLSLIYYKSSEIDGAVYKKDMPSDNLFPSSRSNISGKINFLLSLIFNKIEKGKRFIRRSTVFARNLTTIKDIYLLVAVSSLVWVLYPVKVFIITRMLDLNVTFLSVIIITFTAYLVSMAPILPGGLGSFEGTMTLMFSLMGFTPAQGMAVALLSRLVTFWFPLLWSGCAAGYLVIYKPRATSIEAGDPVPARGKIYNT